MRNEPCNKCGMFDRYEKGKFSYCRPCHNEAQKKYKTNRSEKDLLKPPAYSLEQLMAMPRSFSKAKSHCINGHPFSGDNVRISSQRNGKHLRRRCRTCERNAKRVSYGLQPEPRPMSLGQLLEE